MRWILSAASLVIFSSSCFGQSAAAPAFEVASVKLHTFPRGTFGFSSGGPAKPQVSGNRVTISFVNLTGLLTFAYNMTERQISNPSEASKPSEGRTAGEIYDIAAVTPGEAAPGMDQIRLMVQTLLADRFQLKLHRETATFPVYNLLVGKNGSKLKASAPDTLPSTRNKNGATAGNGPTYDIRVEYTHQPVSELVRLLSSAVRDRVVLDKTGLTGAYDFTLEYTLDPADRSGAAQTTAVQEQLGLRLEPAQESMDMLVIESVQRPSEN
jgi:uncharacterized protein (TIGR03435 family)